VFCGKRKPELVARGGTGGTGGTSFIRADSQAVLEGNRGGTEVEQRWNRESISRARDTLEEQRVLVGGAGRTALLSPPKLILVDGLASEFAHYPQSWEGIRQHHFSRGSHFLYPTIEPLLVNCEFEAMGVMSQRPLQEIFIHVPGIMVGTFPPFG
jgi:hypothetical protein